MAMKVFITGGCGTCGTALWALPYKKVIFDKRKSDCFVDDATFVQGDIKDTDLLMNAMKGCRALIHLAASDYYPDFAMGEGLGSWDSYLTNNIISVKTVFDAAVEVGMERIVFASTHRVMGMYETAKSPDIYELGHGIMIDHLAPVRPDSIYAVTKVFGENLGRLMVDESKTTFYALRICSVRSADANHPYAYAEYGVRQDKWTPESQEYQRQVKRLKALWQSRRDFRQMVDLCLKCNHTDFDIFYGVSNNPRRWFDIDHAKEVLGYNPRDNAEDFQAPPTKYFSKR